MWEIAPRIQQDLYQRMGRPQNTETMNQVYREFSRQKYNKYKHQYPKMRESEIVSKIIKEWDTLGTEGKEKLHRTYCSNKFITHSEPNEPDSAHKTHKTHHDKHKIEKLGLDKTAEKDSSVKAQFKEDRSIANDFEKEGNSEQGESKRSIDSGSVAPPQTRSKKSRDYITFYKFYYDKYHKEHDNWTSNQLSKVISLLWEKRKRQHKKGSVKRQANSKQGKLVTGYKLFRKIKKLTAKEVKSKWSHLPKQSRNLWNEPGLGRAEPASKAVGKMVLKSGCEPCQDRVFSFLSKYMN